LNPSNGTLPDPKKFHWALPVWFWAAWFVLFLISIGLDTHVRTWISPEIARFVDRGSVAWAMMRQPGEFWLTVLAAMLIWRLHPWGWRGAFVPILSGAMTALLVMILKWTFGRARPNQNLGTFEFNFFRGGLEGFFDQKNLSAPSGHATLAFSTAMCLTLLAPRAWFIFFSIAALCAAQRVGELAHYPSEVMLGMALGITGARVTLHGLFLLTGQKKS